MRRAVLLTGLGTVGREVLLALLRRTDRAVYVVVRNRGSRNADARAAAVCDQLGLTAAERTRVAVLAGDVATEDFGLDRGTLDRALATTEIIIHSAAATALTADRELCARVTCGGTANALMLAERAFHHGALERYVHVSTTFVAGACFEGTVREDELVAAPRHANEYETSKYDAERIVRAAVHAGLPAAIVRPSMVVGHSRTGVTRDFDVIYPLLRIMASGYLTTFPADADALVHLAPLDLVVDGILAAAESPWAAGRTFHLTAPDPPTVADVFGCDAFYPPGAPRPRLCPPGDLDEVVSSERERHLLASVSFCLPYFNSRLRFDTSNAARLVPLPVTDDAFLARLGRFAIESGYIRYAVA
jgi:thioester reductase-like protein